MTIARTERIKALRASGAKLVDIAKKFNVSKQRIWTILNPRPPQQRRPHPRQPRHFTNDAALSPRQNQVAHMVISGLSNKEIAARLGITVGTVKATVHAIYHRTGAAKHTSK